MPKKLKLKKLFRARIKKFKSLNRTQIALLLLLVVGIGYLIYKGHAKSYPTNNWSYWAPRIRACESGGTVYGHVNWTDYNSYNTSSGHATGGYQITSGTWRSFGGTVYTSEARYASPSQQDTIAKKLFAYYGGSSTGSWGASYSCWRVGGRISSAPALPSCVINDSVCGSTSSTTTSSGSSSSICSTVQQGSSGSCVTKLQKALTAIEKYRAARHCISTEPCNVDPHGIDGSFGPNTRAAVVNYQSSNHLTADGVVGPITWGKLNSSCGYLNGVYNTYHASCGW